MESLVLDSRMIACARMVVHVTQWMEHVLVMVIGLVHTVTDLV
jgi:hypothetical protein